MNIKISSTVIKAPEEQGALVAVYQKPMAAVRERIRQEKAPHHRRRRPLPGCGYAGGRGCSGGELPPRHPEKMGLCREELHKLNPRLIPVAMMIHRDKLCGAES